MTSPGKSSRKLSKKVGLQQVKVWRIINKDLALWQSYVRIVQMLSFADKTCCIFVCKMFLDMKNLDPNMYTLVTFSSKASFHTYVEMWTNTTLFSGVLIVSIWICIHCDRSSKTIHFCESWYHSHDDELYKQHHAIINLNTSNWMVLY